MVIFDYFNFPAAFSWFLVENTKYQENGYGWRLRLEEVEQ